MHPVRQESANHIGRPMASPRLEQGRCLCGRHATLTTGCDPNRPHHLGEGHSFVMRRAPRPTDTSANKPRKSSDAHSHEATTAEFPPSDPLEETLTGRGPLRVLEAPLSDVREIFSSHAGTSTVKRDRRYYRERTMAFPNVKIRTRVRSAFNPLRLLEPTPRLESAMGHSFDPALLCSQCGRCWHDQRDEPIECPRLRPVPVPVAPLE